MISYASALPIGKKNKKTKGKNLEERNESQIEKAVCRKADLHVLSAHTGECLGTQQQSRQSWLPLYKLGMALVISH